MMQLTHDISFDPFIAIEFITDSLTCFATDFPNKLKIFALRLSLTCIQKYYSQRTEINLISNLIGGSRPEIFIGPSN
jgi:hypothetical protein